MKSRESTHVEEQEKRFRKKDVLYYIAVTKSGERHLFIAEEERRIRRRWVWLILEAALAAVALTLNLIALIDKLA